MKSKYIYSTVSTILRHLYFTSVFQFSPLHLRGKCCTFYSTIFNVTAIVTLQIMFLDTEIYTEFIKCDVWIYIKLLNCTFTSILLIK